MRRPVVRTEVRLDLHEPAPDPRASRDIAHQHLAQQVASDLDRVAGKEVLADALTARWSSCASTRIASSPTWWPCSSLICLRLSRSIIIKASLRLWRSEAATARSIARSNSGRLASPVR